jgi:hypothetical protein
MDFDGVMRLKDNHWFFTVHAMEAQSKTKMGVDLFAFNHY